MNCLTGRDREWSARHDDDHYFHTSLQSVAHDITAPFGLVILARNCISLSGKGRNNARPLRATLSPSQQSREAQT